MKSFFFIISFLATAILSGLLVSQYSPFLLFSATLVMAIFAASFVNTNWGLYILIFSMLLSPEFNIGSTEAKSLGRGVTLRLDDFLLVVIGLSWFAKNAFHKELGLFKKTPLNRPIFYYISACVVSTGFGIIFGRVDPKTGYLYVIKYFEYFIVFFMMVNHLENTEQIRRFIFCLFLTCFITCIIGMLQIPGGGRVSAPFEGEVGEPNTFGGYLLFIGAVAGGLLSTSDTLKSRLVLFFLLAFMVLPFLYTQSRSSYLAFVPSFLLLGFMSEKRGLVVAAMLIFLILSPLFMPLAVRQRIFYTFTQSEEPGQVRIGNIRVDTSTSARLLSWKMAVKDWTKHPVLGYGVTGYSFIDAQFPRVLVETGIVGLAAFVYLLFLIIKLGVRNLKKVKNPYFIGLIRGFIAGYAGLLFHAVGANTFIIVRIMEPFWLLAGIVAVLPEIEKREI